MISEIDVGKLIADAEKSCCKETYLVLFKSQAVRIGAGANTDNETPLLFIDVSIALCPGQSNLNSISLEKLVALSKGLDALGYELVCVEGQVNCEKGVEPDTMNREFLAVRHLLESLELLRED